MRRTARDALRRHDIEIIPAVSELDAAPVDAVVVRRVEAGFSRILTANAAISSSVAVGPINMP